MKIRFLFKKQYLLLKKHVFIKIIKRCINDEMKFMRRDTFSLLISNG